MQNLDLGNLQIKQFQSSLQSLICLEAPPAVVPQTSLDKLSCEQNCSVNMVYRRGTGWGLLVILKAFFNLVKASCKPVLAIATLYTSTLG